MSDTNNPYGGSGGYAPNVQYGSDPAAAPISQPPGQNPPAGDVIGDTTTAGFAADVIEESQRRPVLVDFWAPWCGPCKQLTPALESAVRAAGGRVKLVKMNIDEHPAIAGQLGIQSIPAVIAFKDGKPADGFMGAIPESQITEFIDKIADGSATDPIEEALAAAHAAVEAGEAQTAAQYYNAILGHDAENVAALGGLAMLLYDAGDKPAAQEVLDKVPDTVTDNETVTSLRARIALDEEVAELGDPLDLARRLADNADDHQARFDLAMIENARGEREKAADHLLAIIRTDRDWNDGAARTQLLTLFEAWGLSDPASLSARRKLSSLLFA